MILVEEALQHILQEIPRLGIERLPILRARGRVLAEDIRATRSIPPWDNSAMDGYAVRSTDIQGATRANPAVLRVLGDLPAGRVFPGQGGPGQAVRIMTGAPIPDGFDTVVQVEETEKDGERVRVFTPLEKGKNIRFCGEDVKAGEMVMEAGEILRPAHMGMLASLQRSMVSVYQQPRVAILSTGDELLEIDEPWEAGKIVNSNSYSLAGLVEEAGGIPLQLGIAKDRPEELSARIREGLVADLLVTSGGVSVGDYDLVKRMLNELGQMNFWKVAMRPGQPLAFGRISGKPLFGLPGNPVSAMVSFEQFVRPSILKMCGHKHLFRPVCRALLREDVPKKAGLVHFIRCRLTVQGEMVWATTTGEQGSGILSSMVKAQGLVVLPREKTLARAGEEVNVMILDPSFFPPPRRSPPPSGGEDSPL